MKKTTIYEIFCENHKPNIDKSLLQPLHYNFIKKHNQQQLQFPKKKRT